MNPSTYNSGDVNSENKPKLTPTKAIKKFTISYGIKLKNGVAVYYAWDKKRQPQWYQDDYGIYPEEPYFTVDYDKEKREWYIGYIINMEDRFFATIDDITGRCDLQS